MTKTKAKTKKAKKKPIMGRPDEYQKKHCKTVIDLMKDGASKAEVCLELDCTFQTFINWQAKHPDFLEAVKRGLSLSKGKWEQIGRQAAFGNCEGFNATSWIFNMKNRFSKPDDFDEKWSDKQEIDHGGKIGLTDLTDLELTKKLEDLKNDED